MSNDWKWSNDFAVVLPGHVQFGAETDKDAKKQSKEPVFFSNPPSAFAKQLIASHETDDYDQTLAMLKG